VTSAARRSKVPPLKAVSDRADETAHVGTAAPGRPGRAALGRLAPATAAVLFDGKKYETRIYFRENLKSGKNISARPLSRNTAPPRSCAGKRVHVDQANNLVVN